MDENIEQKALRAFEKAKKKFLFKDVAFSKAIQIPEMTILLCKGKIGSLIGRNGIIVAELSKELNSKVRVVEESKNIKKIISDTIGNARLLGVNELFLPEGRKITVLVHGHDRKKLATSSENLEKALNEIIGTKTKIEFR